MAPRYRTLAVVCGLSSTAALGVACDTNLFPGGFFGDGGFDVHNDSGAWVGPIDFDGGPRRDAPASEASAEASSDASAIADADATSESDAADSASVDGAPDAAGD